MLIEAAFRLVFLLALGTLEEIFFPFMSHQAMSLQLTVTLIFSMTEIASELPLLVDCPDVQP